VGAGGVSVGAGLGAAVAIAAGAVDGTVGAIVGDGAGPHPASKQNAINTVRLALFIVYSQAPGPQARKISTSGSSLSVQTTWSEPGGM